MADSHPSLHFNRALRVGRPSDRLFFPSGPVWTVLPATALLHSQPLSEHRPASGSCPPSEQQLTFGRCNQFLRMGDKYVTPLVHRLTRRLVQHRRATFPSSMLPLSSNAWV